MITKEKRWIGLHNGTKANVPNTAAPARMENGKIVSGHLRKALSKLAARKASVLEGRNLSTKWKSMTLPGSMKRCGGV